MATGDITEDKSLIYLEVFSGRTATSTAPTVVTEGVDLLPVARHLGGMPQEASLVVLSTAGSATMTVTCRSWGWLDSPLSAWFPLGPGTAAAKGTINEGAALDETGTDLIRHSEPVYFAGHFKRYELQVTAIGGTATAVSAYLVFQKNVPRGRT